MPFMKFIPSVYELKLTTISLYTDTTKEIKVGVGTVFNYSATTLYNRIVSEFRTEIYDHKISIELIVPPRSTLLRPSEIRLNGIFYWDDIPVYDIHIFLDEDTLEITHISAKLFTFMGNNYLSDLEGIRSLCKSFGDPVNTVPPYNKGNTLSSHFINAKKEYTKKEDCVYISLEILDGPPTNLRIIKEVFSVELRKESSRSLLPLSCSLFKQIYKYCDAVPNEFGSNIISYYKIDSLTFLGDFPVQEIRFHASDRHCDYIEIFLKDKDCYSFEEIHSIITSVFKENGINWTDTDNKRFICANGELVFIDEDNIITIKA